MVSKRSSATSRTNTTQDFTFNNVDNAVSDGMPGGAKINFNLANSKSEGISIVNTDQGAISAARDIIISSIDAGSNKFEQAISAIQGTNKDAIKAVTDSSRDASESSLSQFMKIAAVVILGTGAVMLLGKK